MRIDCRRVLGWVGLVMVIGLIPSGTSAQSVGGEDQAERMAFLGAESAIRVPGQLYPADPADSLYREARQALNRGRYDRAARLFHQVRVDYPDSEYVADAYYFEAFAVLRGSPSRAELERAAELMAEQARRFPAIASQGDSPGLRVQIESALAQVGDGAAARSLAARAAESADCDEKEQELRVMALNALLTMNSDRAVPIIREVLASRDECSAELRGQAVFLISQHLTDETVGILIDLAHGNPDPDPEVRQQAVFWLSQVDSPEAIDALEDILQNTDDVELQGQALFAISQHSSDRAATALRGFALREDVSDELRQQAVFWLGQSAGGGAFLRELYMTTESRELREQIVAGIAQSGDAENGAWLLDRAMDVSEPAELRTMALFWASQAGVSVDRLGEIYTSTTELDLKEQAIFGLSQSNDKEGAVTVMMRLAEAEADTELKTALIFWLGQTDDDRVADFLLRILRG